MGGHDEGDREVGTMRLTVMMWLANEIQPLPFESDGDLAGTCHRLIIVTVQECIHGENSLTIRSPDTGSLSCALFCAKSEISILLSEAQHNTCV